MPVKVFNIVTAAGEVGSGTPNAASGRHFSPFSPFGNTHSLNGLLEGFSENMVELIQFKPRNKNGNIEFVEDNIIETNNAKLTMESNNGTNNNSVALIHLVCGSKTGLIYPSLKTIQILQNKWHNRIIVVADCCQLRCKLDYIHKYTEMGFISLVTGSKFFAGPQPTFTLRVEELNLIY